MQLIELYWKLFNGAKGIKGLALAIIVYPIKELKGGKRGNHV